MDSDEPLAAELRIEDIVDIQVLQRIQDTFAKAMGVAAVTVDKHGHPVTRSSNFQQLCQLIRSTEVGLARCQECDARGGLAAYSSGKPEAYVCLGGLMDVAAPITIEGQYLGCILCGQVVLTEDRERFIKDILARNVPLGLPRQALVEAVQQLPSLPRERLDAAVEMLMLTANHIVEIGMANLIQTRLLHEAEEKAAIQAALRDAQLRALQAQINPHFLFNCFNTLSGLIPDDEERAERFLDEMSRVHRYLLRSDDEFLIPVADEIKFAESYLYLTEQRFGAAIKATIRVDREALRKNLPPLSMQVILENIIYTNAISKKNPLKILIESNDNNEITITHSVYEKTVLQNFNIEEGLDNLLNKYQLLNAPPITISENSNVRIINLPLFGGREVVL